MELRAMTCECCGGPIDVAIEADFVRCEHCGADYNIVLAPRTPAIASVPDHALSAEEQTDLAIESIADEQDRDMDLTLVRKQMPGPVSKTEAQLVVAGFLGGFAVLLAGGFANEPIPIVGGMLAIAASALWTIYSGRKSATRHWRRRIPEPRLPGGPIGETVSSTVHPAPHSADFDRINR